MPPPTWTQLFASNSKQSRVLDRPEFDRRALAQARTAYYPGAGSDGDAFRVFGRGGVADVIIHADYNVSPESVVSSVRSDVASGGLLGYSVATVQHLEQEDVYGTAWVAHVDTSKRRKWAKSRAESFAVWITLKRDLALDDDHGPETLGFLHAMDCGIRAFDALFCQEGAATPRAVVIQDHGFGANWNSFGGTGPLPRLAQEFGAPVWLLVATNSTPWPGFESAGALGDTGPGGMHRGKRQLFRRGN